MKKYVQNFWVRFLACVLCSVSIVTGVGAGVLLAGVTVAKAEKDLYKNGQAHIAKNYAAYIYDTIYEGDGNDAKKDADVIEELLKNKNFTCSVEKVYASEKEGEISEIAEYVLYNNLQDASDWDYEFSILEGTFVNYNVDSVLNALRMGSVIHELDDASVAAIAGYFFEETTGLFYYKAGNQYFLADYIMVSHADGYSDHRRRWRGKRGGAQVRPVGQRRGLRQDHPCQPYAFPV